MRYPTAAFAIIGVAAAVAMAPAVTAQPRCTQIGPTTTQCQTARTRGDRHLSPAMNDNAWYGPLFGSVAFGFPW